MATDAVQAGVSGFKAAIEAAKQIEDKGKTDALATLNDCPVPTADEAISQGYKDMAKAKKSAAPKPRAKRAGKSPAPDDAIQPMREKAAEHFKTHGYTPEETKAAGLLRRRLRKWFERFERKLRPYFSQVPPIEQMTIQEMADTETLIKSILDEVDESVYVEQLFVYGAEVIERVGPAFHSRFGRFIPGSELLRNQQGLHEVMKEAVKIPGEDGFKDEIDRIAIEFTGWAPQSPVMHGAMKLWQMMKHVHEMRMSMVQEAMKTSSEVRDSGL